MEQVPCPDGYLLDPRSRIAVGHHELNQYLVCVEEAGWQVALKQVNCIRDKGRKLLIWKALIERMLWLREHNPHCPCISPMRGLAERIEKWTLAPEETDLIEILDRTAAVAGFLAPYVPMSHLFSYIDANGITSNLASAIRQFRARVYDDCLVVNQVSFQLFRSRLDMLAWRDEWTPINLKRCWSEQVRADYRAMRGSEREAWRRLLYSVHGDEGTRPAPKWSSHAVRCIEHIGLSTFCAQLAAWLSPLQKGTTQPLSREGSFLLRSFVWLAQLSGDPGLINSVADVMEVRFRPKSNGQKVIRAAAEVVGVADPVGMQPGRYLQLEDLVTKALSAVFAPVNTGLAPELAERVSVGGEVVYVRGKLDTYEVHIAGDSIVRQSDGHRICIDNLATIPSPAVLPGLGGVLDIVRKVLFLVDDDRNIVALKTGEEV